LPATRNVIVITQADTQADERGLGAHESIPAHASLPDLQPSVREFFRPARRTSFLNVRLDRAEAHALAPRAAPAHDEVVRNRRRRALYGVITPTAAGRSC
jgi:hypothetical protein